MYGYVRNNPTRWTDRKGLCVEDLCIGETIAVVEIAEELYTAIKAVETAANIAQAVESAEEEVGKEKKPDDAIENKCPDSTKEHDGDRKALNDLVKEATNDGRKRLSNDNADTLLDWAREQGIPGVRDDRGTDHWVHGDHIHIPGTGITHIPTGGGPIGR